MEYIEQEPDKIGQRKISNTKWVYIKSEKDGGEISFGYDGAIVPLEEDAKKVLLEKGVFPSVYIKNLDSLFFGGNLLVSPYGMLNLPEGIVLQPLSEIPEDIKAAIFVAIDYSGFIQLRNFISIRDRGNGEFQWAYLFSDWGASVSTEPTDTGVKLILFQQGKPAAELLLPESEKNENIESKHEFFTDQRDNKKYRIVKIGNQTWFAENLKWEGAGITYEKEFSQKKYGRLYTWEEAMKAAPTGWHLPTDEEWMALMDYVGGAHMAAMALKSEEWIGTDIFGFSALPGGFCDNSGCFGYVGINGAWWSSSTEKENDDFACIWCSDDGSGGMDNEISYKNCYFNVRLVRD
jgi:uncharacterized protein (TIGR02145 family)